MNCPDRRDLELHFEEALDEARSRGIRDHAASCEPCAAVLRSLEEEAQSLRRNLPDVLAPGFVLAASSTNPWKPLALIAAGIVVALAGMLLFQRRGGSNVEDHVRYLLSQGEPGKAAAVAALLPPDAVALRLEVARAAGPEEAAAILDPIPLAGLGGGDAGAVSRARFEARTRLFREMLRQGGMPAPFELLPYRLGKHEFLPREAMTGRAAALAAAVAERRDVLRRFGGDAAGLDEAESWVAIARYALGESAFADVKPSNAETRFQFGDLLFRERQFDRAIEAWKPILDDPRVGRRLGELAALRKRAPKGLHVWDYEVETLLGRHPKEEAEGAAAMEALFRQLRPEFGIPRDIDSSPKVIEGALEGAVFLPAPKVPEDKWIATDPDQLHLLWFHGQFRLEVPTERPFTSRSGARLKLHSSYRGPLRARLYRIPDLESFRTLNEETLVARRRNLAVAAEWEQEFAPLRENDMKRQTWELAVPGAGSGLFLLVADARYSPVYAAAKFVVTDVALVQEVALDRVLVFAADRVTGAPIADLALEGSVTGTFSVRPEDLVPSDDSNVAEYKRGFEAAWAGKPSEPEATPGYAAGFQRAGALRRDRPELTHAFSGRTDPDGLLEWKVERPWQEGYRYSITTTASGANYSRVESSYALDTQARWLKAVVYSDRPLYRPGDTAHFKALLRMKDNEGLHPYEGREALVEIGSGGRVLQARTLTVTEFGTASGSFEIPAQGEYWARVNNGPSRGLFSVEEYRKPEFEIQIDHARQVRPGAEVPVEIAVRYHSGDPVAGVPIEVQLNAAPVPRPGVEETSWTNVYLRSFETDARGRCSIKLSIQAGAAQRYTLTVRATDTTLHQVVGRSSFESTGRALGIAVETDRPSYLPGETARVHVLAPESTVLRAEETAAGERFSTTVTLQEGRGSFEYIVPEQAKELQVGIRSGDSWAWSPVPLKIEKRAAAEGLVSLRVDRALYRVGETAKVEVRGPGHVLLLGATGAIHHRRLLRIEGGRIEVPLEIRDSDVPNVFLKAVALREDQLGTATAELVVPPTDRFLTVEVRPDKTEYRPGGDCRAVVRVTDSRGRPVPDCEISLGVVDEAVYGLQEDTTPDLREYFHQYRRQLKLQEAFFFREAPGSFIVWKTPTFVRGWTNYADIIAAGGGGGGRYGSRLGGKRNLVARGGGGGDTASYRRADFRDTAFWTAHLRTGADGTTVATFAFPENLTSFRFTARGITADHKVGEVRANAVVRKSFYVRLATPRVVQEGSSIELTGLVHNSTDRAQNARVAFKSPFPVTSVAPAAVAVPPGGVAQVRYAVTVDRFLAKAEFEFGAEADGESDGVRIAVPGRRFGVPFQDGRSGSLAGGTSREEVFRLPERTIRESLTLTLTLDPGLHSVILEGLEPLIEYPYGCTEQTMTRFLPAAVAARALGDAPHRWKEKLPAVVATGLRRLYQLQHRDGGWGWWETDASNVAMTAYVAYGLAVCKKAGVGVDREALGRASAFLRKPEGETGRVAMAPGADVKVFVALALAEVESAWGTPTEETRARVRELMKERTPVERAMLALACTRLGMKEEADRLAEGLRPVDVPTASLLLQAGGAGAEEALRFVLGKRVGKGWRSTMESAYAILGLTAMLGQAAGSYEAPGRVAVSVNGALVREVVLPGRADPAFDGRVSVPVPAGEKVVVLLAFDGRGTAFYTAALEGLRGGEAEPVARGIGIEREYWQREGEGWRPVEGAVRPGVPVLVHLTVTCPEERDYLMITDPRPDGFEPSPDARVRGLKEAGRVEAGLSDRVDLAAGWAERTEEFRRAVRGDAARESAWAKGVLREIFEKRRFRREERRAAGELPAPDPVARIEHRDDRTLIFVGSLRPGKFHYYYVARPEFLGRVRALPPQVTPMYEPEVFGSGRAVSLEVGAAPDNRQLLPPPGVAGLEAVVGMLDRVDADRLMDLAPRGRPVGELLAELADPKANRAWLSVDGATAAAGEDLRERIEAARVDLAVRRKCIEALRGGDRKELLPVLEEALASEGLARRVFAGAQVGEVAEIDTALLWVQEDREFRTAAVGELLRLRNTTQVQDLAFKPVTMTDMVAALGPKAPKGDALVHWKLSQRAEFPGGTLEDLAAWIGRSLDLPGKLIGGEGLHCAGATARVSEILDQALSQHGLYHRVREGELWIGPLDALLK